MRSSSLNTPLIRTSKAFETPVGLPPASALYTSMSGEKPVTTNQLSALLTQVLQQQADVTKDDRKRNGDDDEEDQDKETKPEPPENLKKKRYYVENGRTNKHKRAAPPPPVNDQGCAVCDTCGRDDHISRFCPQNQPMCRICSKPHRGRCYLPCTFCGKPVHRPAGCFYQQNQINVAVGIHNQQVRQAQQDHLRNERQLQQVLNPVIQQGIPRQPFNPRFGQRPRFNQYQGPSSGQRFNNPQGSFNNQRCGPGNANMGNQQRNINNRPACLN